MIAYRHIKKQSSRKSLIVGSDLVGMVPEKSVRTFLTRLDPASDPKRFKSKGKTKQGQGQPTAEGKAPPPVNGWIPLKRTNRALLQHGILFFRKETRTNSLIKPSFSKLMAREGSKQRASRQAVQQGSGRGVLRLVRLCLVIQTPS